MKIALGMIIRSIESETELLGFIENAEKHGHELSCVIVAYTLRLDPRVAEILGKKVPFYAVDIKNPAYCAAAFRSMGLSDECARVLLECPVDTSSGLVPYGFNRTIVAIEAILRGADVLFFVDSDVYPSVLVDAPGGCCLEETDFFGAHLNHLRQGSMITTGEYSGYNILPPAQFDGMDDLLFGLQKGDMLEYWQSSGSHRSLRTQEGGCVPVPCTKILGGNSAIMLPVFKKLPPFFSTHYTAGGELFLGRGEDTTLGLEIKKNAVACTDIGLNPMHDTYRGYPSEPDLQNDPAVQERFYYACTGWIGRNPFLNYINGSDLQSDREYQRSRLERGLRALAGYTSNPRFNGIMENFDVSWDSLGRYAGEYERVSNSWKEFIDKIY